MSIVVLSGGVGGARFLSGLAGIAGQERLTVISNTGDDTLFYGLRVSPDIDIVLYTLAGLVNGQTGWGLRDDTFLTAEALGALGEEVWFHVGDRDLATHLLRTKLLGEGKSLSQATKALAARLGVAASVLPVSDDDIRTTIYSGAEAIPFQDYMVKQRCRPRVDRILFEGMEAARPAPGVLESILGAGTVILAPSNPFVSIGTILQVPGVRGALRRTRAKVAAVSPIVAGAALKGPAAAMLEQLGMEASALGVARLYADFLDLYVADERDSGLAGAFASEGIRTVFTDTLMVSRQSKEALASAVLGALASLAPSVRRLDVDSGGETDIMV